MANRLQTLMKSVGIGFTAIVTHHYGSKVLDWKETENANIIENEYQTKIDSILKNTESLIENQENTEKASSLLGQCLQKLTTSKNNLDSGEIEKGKENFNAAHDCITKVMDMISKPKNNFHIDLSPIYQYLDSLTLLEESALLHICFFTLIFFISINIISTLFANEMILYFNLGDKHPYLKKQLLLRSKFQRYYFILNFSLLFIIIIVALSLNLIILI